MLVTGTYNKNDVYEDYITLDKNIKFGNVLRISPTLPVEKEELNYLVQNLYNELGIEARPKQHFIQIERDKK